MTTNLVSDRLAGGVWGALIGDALGVPVEFSERARRDLDPVVGMRAFGMWNQPAGAWSDDGALLLCSVEGLLDGFEPRKVGGLFVRWAQKGHWAAHGYVFDIGNTTRLALDAIAEGVDAVNAGGVGVESNGNGSLMRILPVALRFNRESRDVVVAHAMALSRVTHAHIRAQLACAFYCLVAVALLHGDEPGAAYRKAIDGMREQVAAHESEVRVFARLMSGDLEAVERSEIRSDGYVVSTLEAALWCLLRETTFEKRVLAAVNLGGDTDTTGCVAGGLAGLIAGRAGLPVAWLGALRRRDEVDALIGEFQARCG